MKIAIIGAGGVGSALGQTWAAKGHEIQFAASNPASPKLAAALEKTKGASASAVPAAAAWADVVVLATSWTGAQAALEAAGDLRGKPLLDATNPLTPSFQLALGHSTSGGEQVQAWAPSASVVKIFNTTGWENMMNPAYPAGRAAMVFAGGDAAAKEAASRRAGDLGFEALDLGGLDGARYLEPAAMVWIKLAIVQKLGRNVAFALMRR
jgi:8-hydroxy-5-deazaflavin:NADPH oxidoreductase